MAPIIPKTKFLDTLTRVDELLIINQHLLEQLLNKEGLEPEQPINYTTLLRDIRDTLAKERYTTMPLLVRGKYIARSADGDLTKDIAIGEMPVTYLDLKPLDDEMNRVVKNFRLTSVKYYLVPANAVTYKLYLYDEAVAGTYDARVARVFETDSGKAASTTYLEVGSNKLPIDVHLSELGKLYFGINWSAAPGNTTGFIQIRGELLSEEAQIKR